MFRLDLSDSNGIIIRQLAKVNSLLSPANKETAGTAVMSKYVDKLLTIVKIGNKIEPKVNIGPRMRL
jgi:hypothetical protein